MKAITVHYAGHHTDLSAMMLKHEVEDFIHDFGSHTLIVADCNNTCVPRVWYTLTKSRWLKLILSPPLQHSLICNVLLWVTNFTILIQRD